MLSSATGNRAIALIGAAGAAGAASSTIAGTKAGEPGLSSIVNLRRIARRHLNSCGASGRAGAR
jgi:hypothetical protein